MSPAARNPWSEPPRRVTGPVPDNTTRPDEHWSLIVYATRYALGRASYAPGDVMQMLRAPQVTRRDLKVVAKDIRDHLQRHPDTPYADEWLATLGWIEAALARAVVARAAGNDQ